MKRFIVVFVGVFTGLLLLASAALATCASDSVQVGPICVDKYEASVWETTNAALIKKIKKGTVTEAQLIAGAIQRGVGSDDYLCDDNGNDCTDIYAVSIAGVTPSRFITWFQAQQAAANSGKRLLANAEWQMAAAGTVDPGANDGQANTKCNTGAADVRETGNAGATPAGADSCISRWGVQDMVGNLWEWVADWVPVSEICVTPLFADDLNCLAGADATKSPGTPVRGGTFDSGTGAGVFAVYVSRPTDMSIGVGFRAAR